MKVSPPSPAAPTSPEPRPDGDVLDVAADDRGVKRRRTQCPADFAVNGHRLRKHLCPRRDDDGDDDDDDDDDDAKTSPPARQDGRVNAEERTSPPPPPDDAKKDNCRQTTVIENNSCNSKEDCMTSAIRNAVQQLVTNNDSKITISLSTYSEKNVDSEINKDSNKSTIPSSPIEHFYKSETINDNNFSEVSTDFDCPAAVTADDCVKSETSNDDCLSQSPLNLTRSQGSSEGGNKSEDDDEGEYDDFEEKHGIGCITNEEEGFVNGNNLPPTDVPFPWNITSSNYNKQKQHQGEKITTPPPQLLLTSGQLTTGCLQAAQLLIPTARGIMTQTILAIPINDMVSSAITASTSNQQQLQQQLSYYMSNSTEQKNNNRQQLNQTCQSSLPAHNRYFQHQNTTDETTNITCTPDNIHQDNDSYDTNFNNNSTYAAAEQYNNHQKRKWQSPDLTNRKHHFLSPQQKLLHHTKNGENVETIHAQHPNECSVVQTPAGTIGDCHIYPTNNAPVNPMSPPNLKRNDNSNGGSTEIIQRQTVWPTATTTIDHLNDSNAHNNEDELFLEMSLQHHSSHGINSTSPTSSTNINTLKSLVPPSTQLNSNVKQSKEDDSTSTKHSAAAAAAAYNQQNAICTALATHMLCASQLAATQQPMFDNMDNSNAVKKPNHIYNNNNNNIKTNNMMGVVNPAALEKWMMEERYYYNNNNNNNKNISAGQAHHQRYNAAAAAAAVAVELLSGGGVPASSSGGGDGMSCKKRKRRTSFTPHALELLNGHFERNTHPSGSEITGLAHRLGYEREVIRIWFCNKRQALKNTVRTINGSGPTHISSKSHNNINGY